MDVGEGKSKSRNKYKGRSDKSKSDKAASGKAVKPKVVRPPMKKTYKVVIRKLPYENYSEDQFKECIAKLCVNLGIDGESVVAEHFVQGKLRYFLSNDYMNVS